MSPGRACQLSWAGKGVLNSWLWELGLRTHMKKVVAKGTVLEPPDCITLSHRDPDGFAKRTNFRGVRQAFLGLDLIPCSCHLTILILFFSTLPRVCVYACGCVKARGQPWLSRCHFSGAVLVGWAGLASYLSPLQCGDYKWLWLHPALLLGCWAIKLRSLFLQGRHFAN